MCPFPIDDHQKYFVIFRTQHGFAVEVGCAHFCPIVPGEKYIAMLGSFNCLNRYIETWLQSQAKGERCH